MITFPESDTLFLKFLQRHPKRLPPPLGRLRLVLLFVERNLSIPEMFFPKLSLHIQPVSLRRIVPHHPAHEPTTNIVATFVARHDAILKQQLDRPKMILNDWMKALIEQTRFIHTTLVFMDLHHSL